MSVTNAYKTYQTNAAQTATPGELTLMLYNGCLKFIRLGKAAIEDKNMSAKNTNLLKAQDIIRELMLNLNMDIEISHNMMQMYDYILNRLVEANMENNVDKLNEAESYVVDFRDTWKQVLQTYRQEQYASRSSVISQAPVQTK